MDRLEVDALFYIAAVENLVSILERGILCHNDAARIRHVDLSDPEVQRRRQARPLPNGMPLHAYANLYVNPRNAMMYRLASEKPEGVCLLEIEAAVLDLPGVLVTDQNAASDWRRVEPAPGGLAIIDRERTFTRDWSTYSGAELYRRKSATCAEILVPGRVPPRLLRRVRAPGTAVRAVCLAAGCRLEIALDRDVFFDKGAP